MILRKLHKQIKYENKKMQLKEKRISLPDQKIKREQDIDLK